MGSKKILLRADMLSDMTECIRSTLSNIDGSEFFIDAELEEIVVDHVVGSIFTILRDCDEEELDCLSENIGEAACCELMEYGEGFYRKLDELGIATWADITDIDISVRQNSLVVTVADRGIKQC